MYFCNCLIDISCTVRWLTTCTRQDRLWLLMLLHCKRDWNRLVHKLEKRGKKVRTFITSPKELTLIRSNWGSSRNKATRDTRRKCSTIKDGIIIIKKKRCIPLSLLPPPCSYQSSSHSIIGRKDKATLTQQNKGYHLRKNWMRPTVSTWSWRCYQSRRLICLSSKCIHYKR